LRTLEPPNRVDGRDKHGHDANPGPSDGTPSPICRR
jgi:hypothetical protein